MAGHDDEAERRDGPERQVHQARQHDHRDTERPHHLQHTEKRVVDIEERAHANHRALQHDEPRAARHQEPGQRARALPAQALQVGACRLLAGCLPAVARISSILFI